MCIPARWSFHGRDGKRKWEVEIAKTASGTAKGRENREKKLDAAFGEIVRWEVSADMSDLKTSCPGCGQHIVVDQCMVGQVVNCPGCSQGIRVSAPQRSAVDPERSDDGGQASVPSRQRESVFERLDSYSGFKETGEPDSVPVAVLKSAAKGAFKWAARGVAKRVAKKFEPPVYEPLSSSAISDFVAALDTVGQSPSYAALCFLLCLVAGVIEVGSGGIFGENRALFYFILVPVGLGTFYGIYSMRKHYLAAIERTTSNLIDVYELHLGHTNYARHFLKHVREDPYGAAKSGIGMGWFLGNWWLPFLGIGMSLFGRAKSAVHDTGKPAIQKTVENQIRSGVRCLSINRWSMEWFWSFIILLAIGTIAGAVAVEQDTYKDAKSAEAMRLHDERHKHSEKKDGISQAMDVKDSQGQQVVKQSASPQLQNQAIMDHEQDEQSFPGFDQQEVPKELDAQRPQSQTTPRIAPEGTVFNLKAITVNLPDGVAGIEAGTELRVTGTNGDGTLHVQSGELSADLPPAAVTNDLDLVASIRANESQKQAALRQWQAQQSAAAAEMEAEKYATPTPAPDDYLQDSTPQPRYSNPLDRGPYR